MRFEKTVALLQLVVFVDRVEIHRAHVVELARQLGDDLLEVLLDRPLHGRCFRNRGFALLRNRAQGFLEREGVGGELAQIDLVTPRHVFDKVLNPQLQLRLADFVFAARIAQIVQGIAQPAQFAFLFRNRFQASGSLLGKSGGILFR